MGDSREAIGMFINSKINDSNSLFKGMSVKKEFGTKSRYTYNLGPSRGLKDAHYKEVQSWGPEYSLSEETSSVGTFNAKTKNYEPLNTCVIVKYESKNQSGMTQRIVNTEPRREQPITDTIQMKQKLNTKNDTTGYLLTACISISIIIGSFLVYAAFI